MPSKPPGRIVKARYSRNDTRHQRNHRWETFTTKLAKFNSLQPLRKVRRHDLDNEDLSAATSYFQHGLQKWSELSISKAFIAFKREALPLCESLAQLLHFEQRIMELLEQYISIQEKESLEPLLELLTAFAHDLGARFEKHYGTSLNLIVAIAGRPQDVEVIEWTFAALAFLFKYLSKLLAPNLRPTFDVVSPLLGKGKHPPHIARFSAEALSFLVKKAAAPSYRETSLSALVEHVKNDLVKVVGDRQFTLYKDGIMTMFAEAIKGTDHSIHSTGSAIVEALIDAIPTDQGLAEERDLWTDVVCGVLTSVIHHAMNETFGELAEAALERISSRVDSLDKEQFNWSGIPYIKLLGILAGVRKGTRISDWHRLVQELSSILDKTTQAAPELAQEQDETIWKSVMVNVGMIWTFAPVDALIPHMRKVVQSLTRAPLMKWFIPFCSYTCEINADRFGSLLRNDFQKFVATHWSQGQNQDLLCVLLPKMMETTAFPQAGEKDSFRLPQAWQDQIVSKFENLEISPFPERGPYNKDPRVWRDKCLPQYSALLRLLELATVHPSTNARIAELLLRKLKLALRPSSTLASDEVAFIVGKGFHAYLRMSRAGGSVDSGLSPLLRASVPRFARSAGFLDAYLAYEEYQEVEASQKNDGFSSDSSSSEDDPVITSLIENLSSPSHQIRQASLKLLKQMDVSQEPNTCTDIMLEVESLPLGLAETRAIAMHLRNLAQRYPTLDESSWLRRGVPTFVFGMLTVKLSPVWDDATETLKDISQTKSGDEIVSALALRWIDVPSPRWTPPSGDGTATSFKYVTAFDCTAYRGLERKAKGTQDAIARSEELMRERFDEEQKTADTFLDHARSRALKVLNAAPVLVEKRSRQLVPYFLSWASEDEDAQSGSEDGRLDGSNWSTPDRKDLLGVFSQFVNPLVLFQHEKVYNALLHLLENGDGEIQKLALKGILAWRQDGVKAYRENLEYLLDDARFKNELTIFLQGELIVKPEHRPELMPVLLRLLYGRTIAKKGAASGKHGLHATRLTVLRNLSVEDMGGFLDIAIGKLKDIRVIGLSANTDKLFKSAIISPRKQVGFLNMIASIISELGTNAKPYIETLLNAVLYCLIYASRQLGMAASDPEVEVVDADPDGSVQSLLKVTRATGLKCLNALFQNAQDFQWEPYHDIIVADVLAPRLVNLPSETTQGISGTLQLLSTWTALPRVALFLGPHGKSLPDGALPKVIACLAHGKTKDEVKMFILAMIRNLSGLALAPAEESEFNELIKAELISPNAEGILSAITSNLSAARGSDLLDECIETLIVLSPNLEEEKSIAPLLQTSWYLLGLAPRFVNPKTKGRILHMVQSFILLLEPSENLILFEDLYKTLASLFSYFKDRDNRESLVQAIAAVSREDAGRLVVSEICANLNSWRAGRIDEPDYDARLAAFNQISRERETSFTPLEWLPLLHNCLFFIRMDEEFGVLSVNSADAMRRYIQDAVDSTDESPQLDYKEYLSTIFMPAFVSGVKESSDVVRREFLRVLGFLLCKLPDWSQISDMGGLLGEINEESTEPLFFFNILSPAVSRQLEAMRMLEAANQSTVMSTNNLRWIFIPLLEHFIYSRPDATDDHGLSAQAGNTIGNLALHLSWSDYRGLLQRYTSYIAARPEQQKQTMRLLGKFTDALAVVAEQQGQQSEAMDVDESEAQPDKSVSRLALPKPDRLNGDVVNHFLPTLVKHLHEKDESEVSFRVPVGVIIVKLLKLLPEDQMSQKLAPVLTDISHILRSKAVEARDMARDTLVKIAQILGPSYFGFMLKELRTALTKGYQLHVLSYTIHSMLVQLIPECEAGDLDYCLSGIVTVIMDDIFGIIGQEKDSEGYTTQTKEIKSSKSQDSMELIARTASITHLIHLIRPVQALLMQKVDLKMVRKMDTLLGRVSSGLVQNPAADSRDTLVFCYEVIQNVYNARKPEVELKLDARVKKYLIQKGAKSGDRGKTTKNTYKLIKFAFDVLRSTFKKHDSLRTVENLTGFLPIIGDSVLDGEDDVKIASFRLLAVLVKVPFEDQSIFNVAVREATKCISQSTSTTTELSQAALKMLAVVLRDKKEVVVKDHAIDLLLGKLQDDLTEPLYRHVTFNFLRAVLDRGIETANVYDTMDHVGTVMVTNDDKDTRDLARGAFFQFIREYPQKKARWAKQLNFVVANLKYEREGGRLSVMETVNLLLAKTSDDFVQEVASTCFLPLFFVLANDDSEKCRLAASELIKKIFGRADKDRTQGFLTLLRSWLDKDAAVLKLAFDIFAYYFECNESASRNKKDLNLVLQKVEEVLGVDDIRDVAGELVEAALILVRVLVGIFPDKTLGASSENLWTLVGQCMAHPHPPAKLASIRLLSLYLADFAKQGGHASSIDKPALGSHGLKLDTERVQSFVRLALNILNGHEVEEGLASEAGQVLIFLGPRLPASAPIESEDDQEDQEEQEEDEETQTKQKDLQYLFFRISHILRKEIRPKVAAISGKTVAMEVLETICRRSSAERLATSFKTILTPLHNITDHTIAAPFAIDENFKTKFEHLKTRAQIAMDALQKKFGTPEYTKTLMEIREVVRARRQARSSKRKIEAIAAPEKYGKDKRKKFEKNRDRKKMRASEQKKFRQSFKGW